MLKKIIFTFLLMLCAINLLSETLNEYNFQNIQIIKPGKEKGAIGWRKSVSGSPSGPFTMLITDKNELYIPDTINAKINIYDLNINFSKQIVENEKHKECHYAQRLQIDSDGNLYCANTSGLRKINSKGELLYDIPRDKLPKEIWSHKNFFVLDNNFLFYEKDTGINYLTDSGKIQNASNIALDSMQNNQNSTIQKNIDLTQPFSAGIIINSNFYSTNFRANQEYFKDISTNNTTLSQNKSIVDTSNKNTVDLDLDKYDIGYLIGYDSEHNSYWRGATAHNWDKLRKQIIVIFSPTGTVIDAFFYGELLQSTYVYTQYPTSGSIIAVSPAGDLYFMVGSKEQYSFYKVERQW